MDELSAYPPEAQGVSVGCRWQWEKGKQIAARQTRSIEIKRDASACEATVGVLES